MLALARGGMNPIALYCQDLGSFPAQRARALDQRLRDEGLGGIEAVYALVWPDYRPPIENLPLRNRERFAAWRAEAGVSLWAWLNAKPDQQADVAAIQALDVELAPAGWLLDIEGEWTKTTKLTVLAEGAVATGKPVRASLAATTSSHVSTDFRTLDRLRIPVEWQSYFDSGEGQRPDVTVAELYRASFVIPGWEYRHRLGPTYGWGKVTGVDAHHELAQFDSYLRPNKPPGSTHDLVFGVLEREWGLWVDDGILFPKDPAKPTTNGGLLMGRAAYANIRVALDVTRSAQARPAEDWIPIAASARVPGARKRPIAIYLAEVASDEVVMAIAEGAGPRQ